MPIHTDVHWYKKIFSLHKWIYIFFFSFFVCCFFFSDFCFVHFLAWFRFYLACTFNIMKNSCIILLRYVVSWLVQQQIIRLWFASFAMIQISCLCSSSKKKPPNNEYIQHYQLTNVLVVFHYVCFLGEINGWFILNLITDSQIIWQKNYYEYMCNWARFRVLYSTKM